MEKEEDTRITNVKIFVRILPLMTISESLVKIGDNKKDIYIRCLQDMKRDRIVKCKSPVYWRFITDGIFLNNSQEEVYEKVTRDLLSNILEGANCVLISYGQTGTGKSFTTDGLRNTYEHRGIIPRLLSDMFEEKQNRKYSNTIEYHLSYVEIYLNQIKDLLIGKNRQGRFKIREILKHVSCIPITNADEALKKIFEGEARKTIGQGENYDASHQGTSILTFHVKNTSLIISQAVTKYSKIHIVDMAGVNSVGNDNCRKTIEQVCNANLDKTQLEQFIRTLQKPNKSKMHYHSNNLLNYLGDVFNSGSLLRFIAHIRITNEDLVLTLSILRFGNNVQKIKSNKISYEILPGEVSDINKLREDVAFLRQELDINEMLLHQEPLANISNIRAKQIEQDAIDFINGSLDDIMLLSISQAQVLLKTFKNMFMKLESDHKVALQQATRDAYDNAAKDLKGSSVLSLNKSSKTAVTGSSSKMKSKKSAVERLSKVTSQASLVEDKTTTGKVGELIDSGITIGSGQPEPAIGPVVRLMKINRSGEPLCGSVFPCSNSADPEMTLKVVDRDEAFNCFLKENEDAVTLENELSEVEEARKSGQAVLMELILKHNEIKNEIERARLEFRKQQNLRHLTGNELYDNEGRIIISEIERQWFDVVKKLEKQLCDIQCQINLAEEELKQLVNNELNASYKLECMFQTYCEKINNQVLPRLKENESKEKNTIIESIDIIEQMKSKFIDMQNMMRLMIENKPVAKQKWHSYIRKLEK